MVEIKRLVGKDGAGNIVQVGDKVRIEPGPVRKKAVATKELLDDGVTAAHYHEPRQEPILDGAGKPTGEMKTVVAIDALSNPIKLGQEMDYIDWKAKARVFYIYVLEEVKEKDKDGNLVVIERWLPKSEAPNYEDALTKALALA